MKLGVVASRVGYGLFVLCLTVIGLVAVLTVVSALLALSIWFLRTAGVWQGC